MIRKEDLKQGQLYMYIEKGKMYVGEFTGNYVDNKAEIKYNDKVTYIEVEE